MSHHERDSYPFEDAGRPDALKGTDEVFVRGHVKPRASFGRADELFSRLTNHQLELDVWAGELYLEYHRGTYTTQALTKKHNRRLEQEVAALESLWTAVLLDHYPRVELDALVKALLLHQFHDIIPGSSIHQVYLEAEKAYEQAFQAIERLRQKAGRILLAPVEGAWTLYNSLPYDWVGDVEVPRWFGDLVPEATPGEPLAAQWEGETLRVRVTVPAQGFLALKPGLTRAEPTNVADPLVLENELIRYRFDQNAQLVEAWDKEANRSLLREGQNGNVLSLYEDTPHNFDAWDIDYYYPEQLLEEANGISVRCWGQGRLGTTTQFSLRVGNSTLIQTVRLRSQSKALEFHTEVEWSESRRLVRTTFPLNSLATEATCEVAYGHVKRPTHQNTEWDFAKFEVCAHRWVDISDSRYGAALLNDSKYGHSVRDNVMGLSLLRSPVYPDPDADQGHHEFTYVLYPHACGFEASDVVEQAAIVNRVPFGFRDRSVKTPDQRLPLRIEGRGFSLEALKKAEKEEAWVVRVVENRGLGSKGSICVEAGVFEVAETDLMEWHDGEWTSLAQSRPFELLPFEIKTFKIKPRARSQV